MCDKNVYNYLFVGEFNMPGINWHNWFSSTNNQLEIDLCPDCEAANAKKLAELQSSNCLLRTAVTLMPRRTCSNCKQAKSGVKLCADDLLCPDCEDANAKKLAELQTKSRIPIAPAV